MAWEDHAMGLKFGIFDHAAVVQHTARMCFGPLVYVLPLHHCSDGRAHRPGPDLLA